MTTTRQIATELYRAIRVLGGGAQLLSIVGSYGDTLHDDDVLTMLRAWNDRRDGPLGAADQNYQPRDANSGSA
ncbi:MAG: hypothetical protein WDO17_26660 [Alphaproteobacteria bacterium]